MPGQVFGGGVGPDLIIATEEDDVVFGDAGGDTIYGRGGADQLFGNTDD